MEQIQHFMVILLFNRLCTLQGIEGNKKTLTTRLSWKGNDAIDAPGKPHQSTNTCIPNTVQCTCAEMLTKEEKMLPAGTLIHVVPVFTVHGDKISNKNEKVQEATNLKSYVMKIVDDASEFDDIKISSNMVSDHMPPQYVKSLSIVKEKWK